MHGKKKSNILKSNRYFLHTVSLYSAYSYRQMNWQILLIAKCCAIMFEMRES